MKKFAFLLIMLIGGLVSTTSNSVLASGGGLCCFNTSVPGLVYFSYAVYHRDGTMTIENVPGIRLSCGVE